MTRDSLRGSWSGCLHIGGNETLSLCKFYPGDFVGGVETLLAMKLNAEDAEKSKAWRSLTVFGTGAEDAEENRR